jgi:TRAP-type C4-dicarboxylate transport system permease small subunit
MAVRRNTHIHVEFIFRYLPPAVGRVLSTLVDIVRIAFLG